MQSKIDFRTLHEGFLQDILDLASNGSNTIIDRVNNMFKRKENDRFDNIDIKYNLAKSAQGLTATFPVLVTEATKVEDAVMISKAIERKAMTLLQMLFAAYQITDATNAKAYLRKFHHNIDTNIDLSELDVDDVIEYTNKVANEHAFLSDVEFKAVINEAVNFVLEDTKNNIHHVLTGDLNEIAINEYTCTGSLQETEIGSEGYGKIGSIRVDHDGNPTTTFNFDQVSTGDIKDYYEALSKNILSSDIKKANEAVPSLMIVNFTTVTDAYTGHKIINTVVIGVKAVLHYVSSEDMINHMIIKNSDKHGLFNFIRATTREISFFKDFLFAVDRAKVDALSRSGKGSNNKLWKVLELRADEARYNRKTGKSNTDCAAITSLIINKSEVDLIKKYHRIDLTKPGQLLGIMRGYNLMCAIIIDEVAEKVDILFDNGDSRFETLSFMSLERDSDNGQLKKVINIMASAKGR